MKAARPGGVTPGASQKHRKQAGTPELAAAVPLPGPRAEQGLTCTRVSAAALQPCPHCPFPTAPVGHGCRCSVPVGAGAGPGAGAAGGGGRARGSARAGRAGLGAPALP